MIASIIISLSRFFSWSPLLSTSRLFRALLPRFSDGPFDVTALGVQVRCYPWSNISDRKLLLAPRHCSPWELRAIKQALAQGGTFVDIGANIGIFTLQAAILDRVRVLAVEPNPVVAERLKFNLAANKLENVTVVETVIGARDGETPFTCVLDDLGKSGIGNRSGEDSRETHSLPMRRLIGVLDELGIISITALKVDVEGYEDDVLIPFFEAAKRSQWPRFLLIEDNRSSPPSILSTLDKIGYRPILRTKANVGLVLREDSVSGV